MDINQNCAITEQEVQTQHRVNHVILPVEKTGGGGVATIKELPK